jgi:hypothetical protein
MHTTLHTMPPSQWRSARTTNAIERLHEEFKRRIKTQTVLPSAETAAMLFWALLASGQINMRKVDGWQTLSAKSHRSANRPRSLKRYLHVTGDAPRRIPTAFRTPRRSRQSGVRSTAACRVADFDRHPS